MATINETIKIQVKDYLDTANLLDKRLNEDRLFYDQLKNRKKENPEVTFEEMQPDLESLTKRHQRGVLMMKDLESLMNRLTVLHSLSVIAEIDLELPSEYLSTLENVAKVTNLFFSSRNGEIIELQADIIEKFVSETATKYITEETLREQFNNL
jgi:hypothetical protein